MEALRRIRDRHERLKNYVHTAFRYPLPPAGRKFMGLVYFLMPVVGGWYVMQWAISKSHDNIGKHGEKLPAKLEGLGQHTVDAKTGALRKIGAGGWGGGVNLANSDEETQKRNKKKLKKFLKRLRKQHGIEEETK